MRLRMLAAGVAALTWIGTAPAIAQSASQAVRAFGLVGAWSPECAGAFRVIYAAPADANPTVRVVMRDREIAASEIRDIVAVAPSRITWRSVIKVWSLPDRPLEPWMPQPGEIWETTIAKTANGIRPLASQRQDGGKVSVRGGFIYTGEPGNDTGKNAGVIVWRNTGKTTSPLEKCSSGRASARRD